MLGREDYEYYTKQNNLANDSVRHNEKDGSNVVIQRDCISSNGEYLVRYVYNNKYGYVFLHKNELSEILDRCEGKSVELNAKQQNIFQKFKEVLKPLTVMRKAVLELEPFAFIDCNVFNKEQYHARISKNDVNKNPTNLTRATFNNLRGKGLTKESVAQDEMKM